jgi:hypothetical protein
VVPAVSSVVSRCLQLPLYACTLRFVCRRIQKLTSVERTVVNVVWNRLQSMLCGTDCSQYCENRLQSILCGTDCSQYCVEQTAVNVVWNRLQSMLCGTDCSQYSVEQTAVNVVWNRLRSMLCGTDCSQYFPHSALPGKVGRTALLTSSLEMKLQNFEQFVNLFKLRERTPRWRKDFPPSSVSRPAIH